MNENSIKSAIEYAYKEIKNDDKLSINNQTIVDKVRKYFNKNNIKYNNFSFDDLELYL